MIGYLTHFGATVLVDLAPPTSRRALELVDINLNGGVILRTAVLPNGVKINLDAGSTSPKQLGSISQSIKITSGGVAVFDTLKALEGTEATLKFQKLMAAPQSVYQSTNSVLIAVKDLSQRKISPRDIINIGLTFELFSAWTQVS